MLKRDTKKIIEAFRLFPLNPNRINEIVKDINYLNDFSTNLIFYDTDEYDKILELKFEIVGFGELSKLIDVDDVIYYIEYNQYKMLENDIEDIINYKYGNIDKKKIDSICENILIWMASLGKNKSTIPLIINDMPDLVNGILLK